MKVHERALLLSIRPKYIRSILDGTKTVELRRSRIHAVEGTLVILYSTSPTRSVVATATLERIIESEPNDLWLTISGHAGVTRREYDEYFRGASRAFGLRLKNVKRLSSPLPLIQMRARTGLEPAQSFRYVTDRQVELLTAPA